MYKVKQIKNKEKWEQFVKNKEFSLFVQSPKYGEFYENREEEYWIFGIFKDGDLIGGSLVVSTHAKRGDFLYLPYGPILETKKKEKAMNELISYISEFASEKGFDFIRVSPFMDNNEENKELLDNVGLRPSPMHILAETSWVLDITKKEKRLMMNMKKNHRNMVRRCMREDVKIEVREDKEALKELNDMHDIVAERHDFERFPRDYINKEFKVFNQEKEAYIYHAYLPNGELDSSSIIIFYGNMAVYRHSASLRKNNKLSTSYLIQWEAIKEAKSRGMDWYNFWGIAPDDADSDHPFYGITRFKKGFGGQKKDLMHCHDRPISYKYWFNWLIESVRRYNRGF
ncbi:MAG: lipid II:glycine glycyltransferase FemX [Candidatus Magasanikbacteria bacterium]